MTQGQNTKDPQNARNQSDPPLHRMRLPGFITDEDIGLGDVIKQATAYVGIKACASCKQRAAALNRWVVFTRRTTK